MTNAIKNADIHISITPAVIYSMVKPLLLQVAIVCGEFRQNVSMRVALFRLAVCIAYSQSLPSEAQVVVKF